MTRIKYGIALLVLPVLLVLSPRDAWSALRANYEISLRDQGKVFSTRSVASLETESALEQELGPFMVRLLPIVGENGAYSLEVSVRRLETAAAGISSSATRSFPGSLGGPLEFTASFGEIEVSGAIMLHTLGGDN